MAGRRWAISFQAMTWPRVKQVPDAVRNQHQGRRLPATLSGTRSNDSWRFWSLTARGTQSRFLTPSGTSIEEDVCLLRDPAQDRAIGADYGPSGREGPRGADCQRPA